MGLDVFIVGDTAASSPSPWGDEGGKYVYLTHPEAPIFNRERSADRFRMKKGKVLERKSCSIRLCFA
jgi:hypothetical protein